MKSKKAKERKAESPKPSTSSATKRNRKGKKKEEKEFMTKADREMTRTLLLQTRGKVYVPVEPEEVCMERPEGEYMETYTVDIHPDSQENSEFFVGKFSLINHAK